MHVGQAVSGLLRGTHARSGPLTQFLHLQVRCTCVMQRVGLMSSEKAVKHRFDEGLEARVDAGTEGQGF